MKKRIFAFLVSLLLFNVLCITGGQWLIRYSSSADGTSQVIRVPSENFKTIQEAINNASLTDTIIVAPGTYQEHLEISKSLTIIGEDRETTIIDGSDGQYAINITSDSVTIESVTITKSVSQPDDRGVSVERSDNIIINNTKITGTYNGVTIAYCENIIFTDNVIANNFNGINVVYSNFNSFLDNMIFNSSEGAFVYRSNDNVFSGNTFSNNVEGMYVYQSTNNQFFHNNFEDTALTIDQSPNAWNVSGEGNYWSSYDFMGQDANSDGIGKTPFPVGENNTDYYPLMGVFSEYSIPENNNTYSVNLISNSSISDFKFETGRETGNKMISFNATTQSGTSGFCRTMIPTSLMDYPFVVVTDLGLIPFSLLNGSGTANAYLYFSYSDGSQIITVVSSSAMQLYNSLRDEYAALQADLDSLNSTYQELLSSSNTTVQTLLNSLSLLLENFTQLQNSYSALNSSLQNSIVEQSGNVQNMRNLAYVFAALTGAFLLTTTYLSARLRKYKKTKPQLAEEDR